MALNELGVTVPAGSDVFDPQGDMVALANSLGSRVIVPVANTTERAALVAAISWTPTVNEPLYVHRGDAGYGLELERTSNGTAWRTLSAVSSQVATGPAAQTDYGNTPVDVVSTAFPMVAGRVYRVSAEFEGSMLSASGLVSVRIVIAGSSVNAGLLKYSAGASGEIVYGAASVTHTAGATASVACAVRVQSTAAASLRLPANVVRVTVQDITTS